MRTAITLTSIVVLELGLVLVGVVHGSEPTGEVSPAARADLAAHERRDPWPVRSTGNLADRLLARPLFAPGRRPAGDPPAHDTPPAAPPRLMGIVVAGTVRRAMFAGEAGARPKVAGEGDRLGSFIVMAIGPDEVMLDGPAGRQLLQPGADAGFRRELAALTQPVPLVDPARREAETESDQ